MGVQRGDSIAVSYVGTLEDGTIFSKSDKEKPFQFTVGNKEAIRGFDEAVVGMNRGEKKEFTVQPQDAYGEYNQKLVQTTPIQLESSDMELKVGMTITLRHKENGQILESTIYKMDGKNIYLDFNHPLAGKTLHFAITLL